MIDGIVDRTYEILCFLIIITTFFIDKSLKAPFPNRVPLTNSNCYYLSALVLMAIAICSHISVIKEYSDRHSWRIIGIISILAFAWQVIFTLWTPYPGADIEAIRNLVENLDAVKLLEDAEYLSRASNNANLAIILSLIYAILGNWRMVMLFMALLVNLSVVMMVLALSKVVDNKTVVILFCIVGHILISMTGRAPYAYTDSLGMPFVTLYICLYVIFIDRKNYDIDSIKMEHLTDEKLDAGRERKIIIRKYVIIWFAITILACLGTIVKATCIIPFLAIIINEIILHGTGKGGRNTKSLVALAGIVGICLVMIIVSSGYMHKLYRYQDTIDADSWQRMLIVGQNSETYGTYSIENIEIRNKIDEEVSERKERQKRYIERALQFIKERRVIGNIKFYVGKINVAYNDGMFNSIQISKGADENTLMYKLYTHEGSLYPIVTIIRQVIWDAVLLCIALGAVMDKKYRIFKIIIVGITLYLMIFENRSKYLYMFAPLYLGYTAINYGVLMSKVDEVF